MSLSISLYKSSCFVSVGGGVTTNSGRICFFNFLTKMVVSANVCTCSCSKLFYSHSAQHICTRTCALSHKFFEVLSASLSGHWNSSVKWLCMRPAIFNAFTGKFCMNFWRQLNTHSKLSPQIRKAVSSFLKSIHLVIRWRSKNCKSICPDFASLCPSNVYFTNNPSKINPLSQRACF